MTSFSQLIDDISDSDRHSLTAVLFRAKVLAARIGSDDFVNWVNAELDGYKDEESVPDYRKIYPQILGDFWGPFGAQVKNVRMTTSHLPENVREYLEVIPLSGNIGSIEEMMSSDGETFHNHWDGSMVEILRRWPGTTVMGHGLQTVQGLFTKSSIRGVLHAIRSRLLNLLLELREKYPHLEDDGDAVKTVSPDVVSQLVQRVVFDNCTVIGTAAMSSHNVNAGRDLNVSGNLLVATTIQDSLNRINESNIDSGLSNELATLVQEMKKLTEKIDANAAKELATDIGSFVQEATKPTPRKAILLAMGKAIKETAVTLATVAVPIVTAVDKILQWFDSSNMGN